MTYYTNMTDTPGIYVTEGGFFGIFNDTQVGILFDIPGTPRKMQTATAVHLRVYIPGAADRIKPGKKRGVVVAVLAYVQ